MTLLKNLETRTFSLDQLKLKEDSLSFGNESYPLAAIETIRYGYSDLRSVVKIDVLEIDAGPIVWKAQMNELDRPSLIATWKRLLTVIQPVLGATYLKRIRAGEDVRLGGRHGVRFFGDGLEFREKGLIRLKLKRFAYSELAAREIEQTGTRNKWGGNYMALYVAQRSSPSLVLPMSEHLNLALMPWLIEAMHK